MIKKTLKIILISFIFVLVLFNFKTSASTKTTIHYIFDKLSVKENEEFTLTIILEKYQDLIGVQFVCNVDEKIFEPINKNNKYFQRPSQSIFEEKEIYENSYTTNQGLRFSGLTKNGKTYGYSNLNMVFSVSFISKTNIEDISKYFSSSIESDGIGSRIILIDKWLNEIDYQINYCESLKASWSENKYIVEVFGKLPNIEKDIKVLNRQEGKYDIEIVLDEINLNILGNQVLKVKIYDYLTTEVVYLARSIEVVDNTPPIVDSEYNVYYLNDVNIGQDDFDIFNVEDNYDETLEKYYKYYTCDSIELSGIDEFNNYLKNNLVGKIGCYSNDSSNNISQELIVTVNVIDTTIPDINEINDFSINDTAIDNFSIESLIIIKDNYDTNPKLIIKNNTSTLSIVDTLKTKYYVEIEYYGVDNAGNETKHYTFKIYLKDTISPTLDNVLDLNIPDEDMNLYLQDITFLEKDFIISDNFNKELVMDRKYYINNELVSVDEFLSSLLLGKEGIVEYQLIDSGNNKSLLCKQKVIIVDDTPPTITVKNIENEGKYLKIDKIDYQVIDNFNLPVDVTILLNGEEYLENVIDKIGKYELKIIVSDGFNNESVKVINFEIVDENIFGCVDGINCQENNYATGLIIAGILVSAIIVIVLIEIFVVRKHKEDN